MNDKKSGEIHPHPIFSVLLLLAIKLLQDIRLHNNTKELLIR